MRPPSRPPKLFSKMSKSYIFDGLDFLFVPNLNSSKISYTRKNLARNGGASVSQGFEKSSVTHVLIDTKRYETSAKIKRALTRASVPPNFEASKILSQAWLVDSIEQQKLLDTEPYVIDSKEEVSTEAKKTEEPAQESQPTVEATVDPNAKRNLTDQLIAGSSTGNPNERTIALLNQMADERLFQGEFFKAKAYKNAINALKDSSEFISSANDALRLKGIGVSVANKIEEIVKTNTLSSLNDIQSDKEHQVLRLLMSIHGVGAIKAKKWYNEGTRTLEDVSKREDLTSAQILGLQYFEEWKERIPRAECTLHDKFMTNLVNEIDPKVQVTIGGSYRRGASDCGDIDFILTKPDATSEDMQLIFTKIHAKIEEVGYMKCALQNKISTKFLSGCALPPDYANDIKGHPKGQWGKCRRIDFLMVPWKERGAAFIYFTGNDYFNRVLRLKAAKNNLVLNESGLFKKIKFVQDKTIKDKTLLVESFSEKKIFKLLGFNYKSPEQRNYGANTPSPKIEDPELKEWTIGKKYFERVTNEEIIDDDVIEIMD